MSMPIDEKTRLLHAADRSEIINIIAQSIITRDEGDWAKLAECYHSEAEFTSSWWHGKAKDFVVAASKRHEEAKLEGGHTKHMLANQWVRAIKGDRATVEADVCLHNRRPINGVELDWATWSHRLYLMERENGEWKIWRRFSIYAKARVDLVDLTVDPKTFFDSKAMEKYPKAMRIHMWRLAVKFSGATEKICIRGTDEEKAVRAEAKKWTEAA
jgi:hypothetical protein